MSPDTWCPTLADRFDKVVVLVRDRIALFDRRLGDAQMLFVQVAGQSLTLFGGHRGHVEFVPQHRRAGGDHPRCGGKVDVGKPLFAPNLHLPPGRTEMDA